VFLDHDQSLTMSAGLSYVLYGTTVGADANYGSGLRRDFANTGKLTPYTQVDLFATREVRLPVVGQLGLRAAILNVLDRQYELRDGSGIGVGAPQFGPRIAAYFGVSKAFGDVKG
jgi:hypothetical protein